MQITTSAKALGQHVTLPTASQSGSAATPASAKTTLPAAATAPAQVSATPSSGDAGKVSLTA